MITRATLILAALLTACTTYDRPLVMPAPIPLQDPLPGGAVVYLFTGPYDGGDYIISSGNHVLAKLSPGSYTVLFLNAGVHVISTKSYGLFSAGEEAAPPLRIDAQKGQRLFFNISGLQSSSLNLLAGAKGTLIYGGTYPVTVNGTRTWKPCSELDAQGLMSILKLEMPEK
jgi:hypothetical protein